MKNTKIEWTDHTINFWWGCTKVSPACTHCYAEGLGKFFGPRLFGQPVIWGKGQPRFARLEEARKEAVKINAKAEGATVRPRVFVNSMSDWLDDEVPIQWLAFLLETIRLCPWLDFQLLTKRPENWRERMSKVLTENASNPEYCTTYNWLSDWEMADTARPNVWIGTTVENQNYADQRIPHLLEIPAKVRFLSCEPLVGQVDIRHIRQADNQWFPMQHIHWVIAGGESGGQAQPSHPDWFRSLRDQCKMAGVPFFFKQWGEWLPVSHMNDVEADATLLRGYKGHKHPDGTLMLRVTRQVAGKKLDGQEWQQFPIP